MVERIYNYSLVLNGTELNHVRESMLLVLKNLKDGGIAEKVLLKKTRLSLSVIDRVDNILDAKSERQSASLPSLTGYVALSRQIDDDTPTTRHTSDDHA